MVIKETISINQVLSYKPGDQVILPDEMELLDIFISTVQRTFLNLPDNIMLNPENKEMIKKLLKVEFVMQSMLFSSNNEGDPD